MINDIYSKHPYVALNYLQFSMLNLILRQALIAIDILFDKTCIKEDDDVSFHDLRLWLENELKKAIAILEEAEMDT
jgi:hypothetical protein